jgi:hypothetical protein
VIKTPTGGIYLHRIHRADGERAVHDHPWWFWSMPLAGSYTELVLPDKRNSSLSYYRVLRRGMGRAFPRHSAHRITSIEGPLWTLVIAGPNSRQGWGFWDNGRYTEHREYKRQMAAAGLKWTRQS